MKRHFLFTLLLISSCYSLSAQNNSNDSLMAAALRADSLFWDGYNRCDVEQMMRYIPADLQFFHDKGGITLGDSAFRLSIKNGLCSDTGKYRLRREVVAGHANAYPMMKDGKIYGVLMTGKHLFYISQNGQKEFADGLAQFADLWLLQDGQWKMARVFSYDHGPAPDVSGKLQKNQ